MDFVSDAKVQRSQVLLQSAEQSFGGRLVTDTVHLADEAQNAVYDSDLVHIDTNTSI